MLIETEVLSNQGSIIGRYLKIKDVPEDAFKIYLTYLRTLHSPGISYLAAGDILDKLDELEKSTLQIIEFDFWGFENAKQEQRVKDWQQKQKAKIEKLLQSINELSTMAPPLKKRGSYQKTI